MKARLASLLTLMLALASIQAAGSEMGRTAAQDESREDAQQAPQFRAGVSRVRVDVVVTDDDGEFVSNLGPADFAVYEDGQPQEILQVQLADLVAGRVTTVTGANSTAGGGPPVPPVPDPRTSDRDPLVETLEPGDYGAMVFVIQTGRLGYWERRRFARAWVELLEQTEQYSFPRAVFAIGYRGQLRQLTPLTYDVDKLREVSTQFLDSIYGRESSSAAEPATAEEDDPGGGEESVVDSPDRGDAVPGREAAAAFSYLDFVFEQDVGALDTLEALGRICNSLYERPGRKAIVWVSEGVLLTTDGRTPDAVDRLEEAANTARVSIYTLDPTLVTERGRGWPGAASRTGPADRALGGQARGSDPNHFRDSLVVTARATGGKSYVFTPRVGPALRDIERDSSRFYLLTYQPPREEGDDQYHDIKVELRQQGLDVRSRQGYTHYSTVEREEFVVGSASQLTELPVVTAGFYRWNRDGEPRVQVGVDMDPLENTLGRLGPSAAVGQPEQPAYEMYFLAYDESGEIADRARERVTRRAPGLAGSPSTYLRDLELGFGRFNVYVMVFDVNSGRQGRAGFQIDIPRPITSWRASQPIFARRNRAGALNPILDGKVTEGTTVQVFLEVFDAHEPVLWMQVVSEDSGSETHQFSAEMTPHEESGIAAAYLTLPAGLTPGSYTIQLSISDPLVRGAANFDLPMEVVARDR